MLCLATQVEGGVKGILSGIQSFRDNRLLSSVVFIFQVFFFLTKI